LLLFSLSGFLKVFDLYVFFAMSQSVKLNKNIETRA
jgi:hypothetical protein